MDKKARREAKKAGQKATKKERNQGPSTIVERGESSTPKETKESIPNSLEKIRKDHMRNLPGPRENLRANETDLARLERITTERTGFLQELLASHTSDQDNFTEQWIQKYIEKEKPIRGLHGLNYVYYNDDHIRILCQISGDAKFITSGEDCSNKELEKSIHGVKEDIAFIHTVAEMGKLPPDRTSPQWQQFCTERYDDIVAQYKFDQHEVRLQMLADAMLFDTPNKCDTALLTGKEYKTVVKITMNEWEAWKRENNSSPS